MVFVLFCVKRVPIFCCRFSMSVLRQSIMPKSCVNTLNISLLLRLVHNTCLTLSINFVVSSLLLGCSRICPLILLGIWHLSKANCMPKPLENSLTMLSTNSLLLLFKAKLVEFRRWDRGFIAKQKHNEFGQSRWYYQ